MRTQSPQPLPLVQNKNLDQLVSRTSFLNTKRSNGGGPRGGLFRATGSFTRLSGFTQKATGRIEHERAAAPK
jgi:hypothetical protein